ncbi:carbohydrate ABC transporter permease (plasmid) [Deinococcus metallilatus]|uniref:Multiple sugar transport system permease protein n=1 Tax=Deinococcus metallilatus TaxID=1211322 RepID=A0ABR6MV36_9DEIO|nr:carbohydrate ABC transporter permease [Deinococcus metallilatus]MBB5295789.1 multiple sugar transport system permease protein [Deinococcus metallilatus]QBY06776.1 carbohydrate ABC transporter permease [Deinococcus metallilatus]GMA14319.1 sugar ABC transporter permease [Deinococcus metallilatus]
MTDVLERPAAVVPPRAVTSGVLNWLVFLLLLAGALAMCAPFVWMLSTSVKPPAEIFRYPPTLLTSDPQFGNYARIFGVIPFGRLMLNSLIVSGAVTLLQLLVCSMAAYAFARLRFWGRDALFLLYLSALMIPSQVTLIPNFILIRDLGWIDSYAALILPFAFSSFGTFLLRQAFLTVPRELEEAARIDGATYAQVFWRVMLPLVRPALGALGIFTFIAQWNNFLWPLITTTRPEMATLTVGLSTLRGQYNTDWALLMTGSVLAILPIFAVFIAGNRAFIRGITSGGFGGR